MIAALWSNPNWDDDKDTRAKVIKEINGSFENALKVLDREFEGVAPASDEPDMSTPFFAAAKRGRAKLEKKLVDADTIKPVDFSEYKVDQDG